METPKPLDGIRVIELASVWAMPGAAMYLADQGADVVKVEPPEGDIGRTIAMTPPIKGLSRAFWSLNRNKRSIVIDLKTSDGQSILQRLARDADVVIQNFRPGAEARLGFDYPTLSEINPRLVYVAYNAFGAAGPRRTARGYDLLVQSTSGVASRRVGPNGEPQTMSIFAIDMASSIMASYAVMLALFQRQTTGQGQLINGSLLQTAFALQLPESVAVADFEEPEGDSGGSAQAVFQAYRCQDDVYFQISIASDREWLNACRAWGDEALLAPEYRDADARRVNNDALIERLTAIFASQSAGHWQVQFDHHDAPGARVESPSSIFASEQALANDVFTQVEQPGIGMTTMVDVPFSMSANPRTEVRPAPELGEHTNEILAEAGYTHAEAGALEHRGVVKSYQPTPA